MKPRSQKVCVVTGANSGVGKEIALARALSGAQVIMVCRNAEKGRRALEEIKAASASYVNAYTKPTAE